MDKREKKKGSGRAGSAVTATAVKKKAPVSAARRPSVEQRLKSAGDAKLHSNSTAPSSRPTPNGLARKPGKSPLRVNLPTADYHRSSTIDTAALHPPVRERPADRIARTPKAHVSHTPSPSPMPHKKNARYGSLKGLEMCSSCGSVVAKGMIRHTSSSPAIGQFNINPKDVVIDTSKVLGKGGFGVVYLGDFQATEVAVKVMLGDSKPDKEELEDWKREIEIMTHLRHPNILALLGAVFTDGKLAIVTEYCAKGSLRKVVRDVARGARFEVTWARKLDWLIQVAKGMAFLHHKKIHHRDLKASNVFVSGDTMKIADFGLSNFRVPGTPQTAPHSPPGNMSPLQFGEKPLLMSTPPHGSFAPKPPGEGEDRQLMTPPTHELENLKDVSADASGTFAFVAPEVWAGKPYKNASDAYAFGVMIIEVVTARVPFDNVPDEDEPRWAKRIRKGTARPVMPKTMGGEIIPPTLIGKTKKCIAFNHKHRPEFKSVVQLLSKELDQPYTPQNCPALYESDDEEEEPDVEEFDGGDDESSGEVQADDDADGWLRGEY
eukprot:TRINITY_DN1722_c1_g1_i1.p1 TRINITY_DN1722_c1_g1~~TRINITY_DN1722_c1_g1_i1.p1  ORF type:complete len:548 (+),score=178.80 TRINITY_DN1722_c1_g1_i1:222-1865(+)